ncbi:MAG: PulJ/GspJ family protein [Candidatus Xenobia bacterium]
MRRGYTLIEIIVALFIGSLVILAATQAVRYTSLLFTRVQAHYLAQTGGQLGVTRFAEDVRLTEPHLLSIYMAAPTPVPPAVTAVPPALTGPNGDSVPLAVAMREKDVTGAGMAQTLTLSSVYIIYFYDQTTSQWLRGQWTKAGPDDPVTGQDDREVLPPTGGSVPNRPSLSTLLSSAVGTSSGLDFPPQVLTRNIGSMSITPSQWPGAPFDLTQGVSLTLTIRYDYTNSAAAAGLQSIESGFTKTFVTCAFPSNHV